MKKVLSLIFVFALVGVVGAADVDDLTKKANSGDAQAMYDLGMAYMNGDGIDNDDAKGVSWLEKAAYKGHSEAQYELGLAIFNGYGVTADRVKGCSWLYTTEVDAAAYNCTQLEPDQRTKALDEAAKIQKNIKK